jgi:integrase
LPSYKNQERNTWYCAFYYTDWHGKRKKKKKEGFKTKREAQEWERKFLEQYAGTPDISFDTLLTEYKKKQKAKNDIRTYYNECNMIKNHIEPYFLGITIDKITKQHILSWKEKLQKKNYAASYSKRIYNILKYIFDFAVENYNLPSNPCPTKQSFGKLNKMINFWTIDEFRTFISVIYKPKYIMAFYMLFWTGMRCGEMLGLEWSDVDFNNNAVTIEKSYYRMHKKDYFTDGKTDSSQRIVVLPQFLADMLKEYQAMSLYCSDRIFDFPKSAIDSEFRRGILKSGVKRIRLHDLRHSHASLLINSDFQPIEVADRLGHADASITLKIYSHFYDKKRTELAEKLNTITE